MSMEETAVLLSIRPEWCQKIFRGEKTMEIRKNFPKDFQGQPFKCFIYCTKGQNAGFRMEPDGSLLRLDGTVIGEFTCDRVYEIAPLNHAPDDRVEDDVIAALSECLRHFDIMNYTEESKPAPPFEAWAIDLHKRFPRWPYKKPKPGHESFRLLDGPAPDFRRMTVEEFEALPAGVWMDVKKTLPPLEHPVLTVDAYGNYHTNTEYIDTPEIPFCITYNDGRFWPPIAWSKFEPLKQGGD